LRGAWGLTPQSRGRPQAGFAHLRPPLTSNVKRPTMLTRRRQRPLYWLSWLLAALAFWLTVGWFAMAALLVDPYYDGKIERVVASVASNAPSKSDVEPIERERASVFKGLGVIGGVLCGFAFGVAACRLGAEPSNAPPSQVGNGAKDGRDA
jgi:hypothetical protein